MRRPLHGFHDVGEELLGEVRGKMHGLQVGLDFVEVLKSQDVVADELRNHSGEEEAQRLDALTELPGTRMREGQVKADPVDVTQEQLPQPEAHEVDEVRPIAHHAKRSLAPLGEDLDGELGRPR